MHCLITHDNADGLALKNLVFNLHTTLCIRADMALECLPTHINRLTSAFIVQHCDKYQNQMRLFL